MLDLRRSQELLEQVFPDDSKYRDPSYLEWQYLRGPSGAAVTADRDDPIGRLGHYAVVPQRWLRSGAPVLNALSLNTAVAERGRGQGLFTALARAAYQDAADQGVRAIIGVANGNSTPGFTGKLGFRNLGPLPVVVAIARPSRTARTVLEPDMLVEDRIVLAQAGHGDTRRLWDPDELRWRLQAPNQRYIALRLDDAVVIACSTRVKGVKFAVILKVFAQPSGTHVNASSVVANVCRVARAPFAVYAGFNPHFRLTGFPVPLRARSSPLNLIVRSAAESGDIGQHAPDCYEFLDFDAY